MEIIPEFEYDASKSGANAEKHGIDFEAAQALWNAGSFVEGPTVSPDEDRWMRVAKFEGKLWSAIFTIRDGRVRLISVRRARPKEIMAYDNQDDHG